MREEGGSEGREGIFGKFSGRCDRMTKSCCTEGAVRNEEASQGELKAHRTKPSIKGIERGNCGQNGDENYKNEKGRQERGKRRKQKKSKKKAKRSARPRQEVFSNDAF